MLMYYTYALLASIFWGVGFIGSRYGLEELGPIWLTFFRFLVAFVVFLPVIIKIKKSDFNLRLIRGSIISGVLLASLITLQIAGLEYTTVAKSGFITILYAFFTPIICYFFYKQRISNTYWSLLGLAFIGMLMISNFDMNSLNYGDFLTLLCAIASAFHIISVSKYAKGESMMLFNLLQMGVVALVCLPLAMIFEGTPQSFVNGSLLQNNYALGGVLFMGIFSTSIAFFLQVKSQQKVPAHVASLIFLIESPLAALLGFFAFQENMSMLAIMGCTLVVFSVGIMPFENGHARIMNFAKLSLVKVTRILTLFLLIFAV